MPLFLVFLIVPLIEIGLFIQIGGIIGLWPTLGIVVLTAILGTYLVREQGLRALADVQQSFQQLDNPSEPLAHGAMILFSGALLLTPGFFTDAVGFALLAPPVRRWLYRYISSRVQARGNVNMTFTTTTGAGSRNDKIIDVEFEEVEIKPGDPNSPSGWTKH